jgi:hypothetical protein
MSDGTYIRQGKAYALNITAATVVATVPSDFAKGQGRLARVQVLAAGATAGAAYDGAALTGNTNTVGTYTIDMPFLAGLVIAPGTGQTVAVSYD